MKKLIQVAVFVMAVVFTSCSKEEVLDFACDTARESLQESVQEAIDLYEENATSSTCSAVKTAIQEYKESQCADTTFDAFLNGLPENCSTILIED